VKKETGKCALVRKSYGSANIKSQIGKEKCKMIASDPAQGDRKRSAYGAVGDKKRSAYGAVLMTL
jgi:hypothetical protein